MVISFFYAAFFIGLFESLNTTTALNTGSFWMVLALLLTNQPLQWDLLRGDSALNMAYLIIGATLATMYLYQKTTVVLGPGRVNAYIYLNPVIYDPE